MLRGGINIVPLREEVGFDGYSNPTQAVVHNTTIIDRAFGAEGRNGGTAEGRKGGTAEWQYGYIPNLPDRFMVHATDTDDTDDTDDTF
jgi:hypothetical protein